LLRQLESGKPPKGMEIETYTDKPDPNCTLHRSCTGGDAMPRNRGVCVQPINTIHASARYCYDICNLVHDPSEYGTGVIEEKWGIAYKVKLARDGLFVRARTLLWKCPQCDPGDRCTNQGWEKDRGMCVRSSSSPSTSATCWDMCDKSIDSHAFGTDAEKTSVVNTSLVNIVKAVRSGDDYVKCPDGYPWWLWPLMALLILCCLCCCIAALLLMTRRKKEDPEEEPIYMPVPDHDEQEEEEEVQEQAEVVSEPPPPKELVPESPPPEEIVLEPPTPEPPPPAPPAPPAPEPLFITVDFEDEKGDTESKTFYTRPLGFRYDWLHEMPIARVHEGGQAERLGVKLHWKLKAVDGKETPWKSKSTGQAFQDEIRNFHNELTHKVNKLPERWS